MHGCEPLSKSRRQLWRRYPPNVSVKCLVVPLPGLQPGAVPNTDRRSSNTTIYSNQNISSSLFHPLYSSPHPTYHNSNMNIALLASGASGTSPSRPERGVTMHTQLQHSGHNPHSLSTNKRRVIIAAAALAVGITSTLICLVLCMINRRRWRRTRVAAPVSPPSYDSTTAWYPNLQQQQAPKGWSLTGIWARMASAVLGVRAEMLTGDGRQIREMRSEGRPQFIEMNRVERREWVGSYLDRSERGRYGGFVDISLQQPETAYVHAQGMHPATAPSAAADRVHRIRQDYGIMPAGSQNTLPRYTSEDQGPNHCPTYQREDVEEGQMRELSQEEVRRIIGGTGIEVATEEVREGGQTGERISLDDSRSARSWPFLGRVPQRESDETDVNIQTQLESAGQRERE